MVYEMYTELLLFSTYPLLSDLTVYIYMYRHMRLTTGVYSIHDVHDVYMTYTYTHVCDVQDIHVHVHVHICEMSLLWKTLQHVIMRHISVMASACNM